MRKIIIDDRELLTILNDKAKVQKQYDEKIKNFKDITAKTEKLQNQIRELQEEFKAEYGKVDGKVKEIQEELRPYMMKIERYKDKINPILKKHNIETDEFEVIDETYIEDGKVVVGISNLIENYKEHLRKQIKAQKDESANNKTNTGKEKK